MTTDHRRAPAPWQRAPVGVRGIAAALGPSVEVRGDGEVTDVTHDSRQVVPGSLFCGVPGATADGHAFAADAVRAGASGLLVERWLDVDGPQIRVPDVRAAMGPAAAFVHGNPSEQLLLIGVTGTNGKTTTTYLLESALGADARGTGVIGTVEARIHGEPQEGVRTTPEGPDLQRLLANMHARGVEAVAMEVSSHGLDLRRVDGCRFDLAVFTNLSADHLDHHGTMEAYYLAKRRLFTRGLSERGVVVVVDEWGRRLAEESEVDVVTLGFGDADHVLSDVVTDAGGGRARLRDPEGRTVEVTTALLGEHNVLNAATAYVAAVAAGSDPDAALAGIAACAAVPGRLEPVDVGQPFSVLVDYAHTPDAVQGAIRAARSVAGAGRVLVVVGCGGDRDREKRPLMGAAAMSSDVAVLTSDNPRSEDPAAILEAMVHGATRARAAGAGAELVVEVDRRQAIALALASARPGDVVLIAGKGHETGQEFADRTVPFDDRDVAAELLEAPAATTRPTVSGGAR